MGKQTDIQWAHSTVNPTGFQCVGCELWIPSRGVRKCYAGRFAERMGGEGAFDKPVELKPGVTKKAASWGLLTQKERDAKPWIPPQYPRMIFAGDMADIFSPSVPFEYLRDEVIAIASTKGGSRHIWQLSTKQANRALQFDQWLAEQKIEWPRNVWMGVSITSEKTLWRADRLVQMRAAVKYVNYAPAWEWLDFSAYVGKIQQIIVEGESGDDAAPFDVSIAYGIITFGRANKIAAFIKQLGAAPFIRGERGHTTPLILKDNSHGGDWTDWPEYLKVRELPTIA